MKHVKKECVAMLLAGGQGSRLYALTKDMAKPAVPYGGKYRIIDFPLSNCVNSGIDTVGVLHSISLWCLTNISATVTLGDLTEFTAAFMYCPLMNRHRASRGMRVRQTLFTRISALSTDTTPNMLQCFRATTSTR